MEGYEDEMEGYEDETKRLHPSCQRCGGELEQGFVPDFGYGAIRAVAWAEGDPEHSFWTGVTVRHKRQIPIVALRCMRCGGLEFFAPSPETSEQ